MISLRILQAFLVIPEEEARVLLVMSHILRPILKLSTFIKLIEVFFILFFLINEIHLQR